MLKFLYTWVVLASTTVVAFADLQTDFANPPASARPWVFWFWNNANVTSNGITADLEAMQRAGIGGVIVMDVVERFAPPRGTAEFMNPEWQNLFQFSVSEAARLGLEINMANGPGWCGSSGPWITPDLSMQKLVWTNLTVTGPKNFSAMLPTPDIALKARGGYLDSHVEFTNFYADIALLAFPVATNGFTAREQVIDLTAKLGADGTLDWDVPPGDWVIERIGRTSTGSSTRPPVAGGNGLECDKLSAAAMDVHFTNMMGRLTATAGPLAGKSLAATHIDSWEVGWQNWTPKLREEFQKRRGYDLLSWLPCAVSFSERIKGTNYTHYFHSFDSAEMTGRFRWDFNQTISELLAENYVGRLAELSHEHGLRLTTEGYDLPFGDEGIYSAGADEPMSEFWTSTAFWAKGFNEHKGVQMASMAHTTGKTVVGAEAFTSDEKEKWMMHPAMIKALGDFELSQGINRFVFHRYAHQPYLDRAPGATMGPWGLHYERTQTWWEMSTGWHEYLTRCQFMLRQGLFVADLLYLRPENPNQTYFIPDPPPPAGYRYDEISAETLLARVTAKNGRLTLPDGMNYRVLVLPPVKTMTPALAEKIKTLVNDGATVVASGAPPKTSPSLMDFPKCDEQVAQITQEIWGDCDGQAVTQHLLGKGKLVWGVPLEKVLSDMKAVPDFVSDVPLNWIHRRTAEAEIYFIANGSTNFVNASCAFRTQLDPEIWNPETGEQRRIASRPDGAQTRITLPLAPSDSVFVVFRRETRPLPMLEDPTNLVAEINGPWTVSFDTKRGGPASAKFPELSSWSDSTNAGIKFYSGTAVYRTSFKLPKAALARKRTPFFLSLGDVQVMARVKVNGQDCGVAWRPPFRVDVAEALKQGENTLEIEVANLWPNRMIGDAVLPETNRVTWSSWQPFKGSEPLLKSGLLGPVRLLAGHAPDREVISTIPAGRLVDTDTMTKIYDEVKTPFKYGVVIQGGGPEEYVDCPSIFRNGEHWYMMYVAITNDVGYQTFLARSDDLLHWEKVGKIFSFGKTNTWDAWQADGGIALCDYRWEGTHELEKFAGKFWLSYIGGALPGYETDPLSIGMAWTRKPAWPRQWNRVPQNPVLSPGQSNVRGFEALTLYKSQVIHDENKTLGWPFVMFYNGKYKNGYEQIGMAVSRDMVNWSRYGTDSVIVNGEAKKNGITGDPQIVKIGDVWTMFYFGAGWKPKAFDTFACSYDLVHWTKWEGPHLIEPSEPFDKTYAHKPWVIKWNGVVYHFYCAVGNEGRVIAVATSRDMKKSPVK
jgi:predicted GH43/DUF377 family glycosyl hydrolase